MEKTKLFSVVNKPTEREKMEIIDFLFVHLEQYNDPKKDIKKALEYAVKDSASLGGFVLVQYHEEKVVGTVVVNQTGMGGYIPENILVYIATHKDHRGKGIGKKLMEETISFSTGDIALHVEQNNPAKKLYEKYGFTNPYLEMRLKRT